VRPDPQTAHQIKIRLPPVVMVTSDCA
jgi:hypothetical protein